MMSSGQGLVEVSLSLMGLNGVVKVVKFVFNNKDTLFKVYGVMKCFFIKDGNTGVFFSDGVKKIFLNLSKDRIDLDETVFSVVSRGTGTLKVLKDNVFG